MGFPKIPKKVATPNWSKVIVAIEDYAAFLVSEDAYSEDHGDYEREIFEEAVIALYGKKVFDTFVNPATDAQDKKIYDDED